MTALVGTALVAVVAAIIALPLLRETADQEVVISPGTNELWKREKAVAMLAITEADFDRATGKLSDEDYTLLRGDYEDRALRALGELERLEEEEDTSRTAAQPFTARFCGQCGTRFGDTDRYCASCGAPRA